MATDETLPIPELTEYNRGYEDGIAARSSLIPHDLQVLSLANALDALARHAAQLDGASHDACLECNVAVLLARVVDFGEALR